MWKTEKFFGVSEDTRTFSGDGIKQCPQCLHAPGTVPYRSRPDRKECLKMRWKANPNLIPPGILLRPYRTKETDWLTVKELCRRAGIPYRVSGGKTLWVAIDPLTVEHFRGLSSQGETVYVVGGKGLPDRDPDRSIRILEVLAYSFHDWASRECLCGRGFFV